jgi:hypothetical protein
VGREYDVVVLSQGICVLASDVLVIMEMMRHVIVHHRLTFLTDADADEEEWTFAERKTRSFYIGVLDQIIRVSQRAFWQSGTYWLLSSWPGHESRNPMGDKFNEIRFNAWKGQWRCRRFCC